MRIETVQYRYPGSAFCLGPLDLEGPEDRPWLVLGPSGSGKSTLLRILGGVMRPQTGKVHGLNPEAESAYLPQFPERALAGRNLAEDLSGNIRPSGEERGPLRQALLDAGLPGIPLSRRSRSLSAGERRRAALALLLLTHCKYWALDEPEAALDAAGGRKLVEVLAQADTTGRRLCIATHRFSLYRSLNPWVLVLESGQVVDKGEFKEVLSRPEAQRILRIGDRPAMTVWSKLDHAEREGSRPLDPERLARLRSKLLENLGLC